jgi:hypothetical protein
VAIAAGAMNEMFLTAIGTLIQRGAIGTGAAGQQGFNRLSFQQRQRVLGLVLGPVDAKDLG